MVKQTRPTRAQALTARSARTSGPPGEQRRTNQDLALWPGSPAIDHGDNASLPPTDQRGFCFAPRRTATSAASRSWTSARSRNRTQRLQTIKGERLYERNRPRSGRLCAGEVPRANRNAFSRPRGLRPVCWLGSTHQERSAKLTQQSRKTLALRVPEFHRSRRWPLPLQFRRWRVPTSLMWLLRR